MDPNQSNPTPQNVPSQTSNPTPQNIPSQTSNPVSPANIPSKKNRKTLLILLGLIAFLIILGGGFFAYQTLTPGLLIVNLPIKADGVVINRLEGILYRFNTELANIERGNPSIIHVNDPRIPSQIVTNETQFFYVTGAPGNQKRILTTIDDMAERMTPNQKVVLFNLYEQDSKRWRLQQVFIKHPDEASTQGEMN